MPGMDGPSPSPSTMPPPASGGSKRPRNSNVATSGAGPSRVKRRKAEGANDTDSVTDGRTRPANSGSGPSKGKEDEWDGEPGEIVTKIDFNNLPVETLYKYLQAHDLLPRFEPSPWSEEPCIPPNSLYSAAPLAAAQGEGSPSKERPSSPTPSVKLATAEATPAPGSDQVEPGQGTNGPDPLPPPEGLGTADGQAEEGNVEPTDENMDENVPAPPTTRSKTLPMRRPPTPPPRSPSPVDVKRGVITLSDVEAARAVLAEKANAHWIKGLGGGQNKEGETIVNFLYKLKAGPTRLLRVYNPWPAT
ncbi:hypothetical protein BD324DRAFT_367955 [Kockovaella imperatae]|uniref:Uncharacterized protein n=1 Tax=Kockovaella imperatae TaxID=4999 RepID=A0A1Y1UKK6_9TREE|nr:hypothetical protein BD324DRAFT_367955 [Kockovaella imperatae]ORX38581.1 hypothetical protein BD324DRAFT_367955 [Kockovaella imperatae]